MNLDIIARLVQILRDSPELGAIEVRRGLFGAWSAVRVSRAGHSSNQGEHVVVSYPCVYDPRQRRITAVAAPGRQPYCDIPTRQLMLFTLVLVRTVWRMPRYRRIAEPRRVLLAPQISLWQRFAD